jgi:hypothetical protein
LHAIESGRLGQVCGLPVPAQPGKDRQRDDVEVPRTLGQPPPRGGEPRQGVDSRAA